MLLPHGICETSSRTAFINFGGAFCIRLLDDPIGRAACVKLPDSRRMAWAAESLHGQECGTKKRCLQCELVGVGKDEHEKDEADHDKHEASSQRFLFVDELTMIS